MGSEMCIRDSPGCALIRRAGARCRKHRRSHSCRCAAVFLTTSSAHPRAGLLRASSGGPCWYPASAFPVTLRAARTWRMHAVADKDEKPGQVFSSDADYCQEDREIIICLLKLPVSLLNGHGEGSEFKLALIATRFTGWTRTRRGCSWWPRRRAPTSSCSASLRNA